MRINARRPGPAVFLPDTDYPETRRAAALLADALRQ
jgi:hypothetical protein